MRIKEAAQQVGVSARMLRHYEAEALLAPRRDSNGYRHYGPQDVATAQWVRDLIAAGFSARELREVLLAFDQRPPRPGPRCAEMMRQKLEQIDRLAEALTTRSAALATRLAALEQDERKSDAG